MEAESWRRRGGGGGKTGEKRHGEERRGWKSVVAEVVQVEAKPLVGKVELKLILLQLQLIAIKVGD